MKVLPHSAHSYGRSPLWMRSCCSRLEVRVKALLTCHTHTAPGLGGGHWGKNPRPSRTEPHPSAAAHGGFGAPLPPAPGPAGPARPSRQKASLHGPAPGSPTRGLCWRRVGCRVLRNLFARWISCADLAQLSPGAAEEQCLAPRLVTHRRLLPRGRSVMQSPA